MLECEKNVLLSEIISQIHLVNSKDENKPKH